MKFLACVLLLFAPLVVCAQNEYTAGMDAYKRGDYATALEHWRPLAEAGSREAQFNLGLMYATARGVDADIAQAVDWYDRAARQGFDRAQYNLAKLHAEDGGPSEDPLLAYVWFKLAGLQKYSDARKQRKRVAKRLTPHEIAQADLMAKQLRRGYEPGRGGAEGTADRD